MGTDGQSVSGSEQMAVHHPVNTDTSHLPHVHTPRLFKKRFFPIRRLLAPELRTPRRKSDRDKGVTGWTWWVGNGLRDENTVAQTAPSQDVTVRAVNSRTRLNSLSWNRMLSHRIGSWSFSKQGLVELSFPHSSIGNPFYPSQPHQEITIQG